MRKWHLLKSFFIKKIKLYGYHVIQSFQGNEVNPNKANQIGMELAEELWGDKYQVLVCTHINKQNIHNHLIVNSVSFVDGKKYHNSNEEIAIMRDTSDRLCYKYGLSVVETQKAEKEKVFRKKRINNFERSNEKILKIRNDIDEAIKDVKKYSDFKLILVKKGYEIYDTGMYFVVKSPYFSRKVRIDRVFGEMYSLNGIKDRIYYKRKEILPVANLKKKYYKKVYKGVKINKFLLNTSSIYRLYVHYLYIFKILPAKNEYKKLTPAYLRQKKENEKIFEELNFLGRNNFKSVEEIKERQILYESKLPELKSKRENWWRKYNRCTDELEKENISLEINNISENIKTIHNYCKICGRCIARFQNFRNKNIENENVMEKTARNVKENRCNTHYFFNKMLRIQELRILYTGKIKIKIKKYIIYILCKYYIYYK